MVNLQQSAYQVQYCRVVLQCVMKGAHQIALVGHYHLLALSFRLEQLAVDEHHSLVRVVLKEGKALLSLLNPLKSKNQQ